MPHPACLEVLSYAAQCTLRMGDSKLRSARRESPYSPQERETARRRRRAARRRARPGASTARMEARLPVPPDVTAHALESESEDEDELPVLAEQ